MNFDKFDNRYLYYLYPVNNLEECLKKGIEITSSWGLVGTLEPVTDYIYNNILDNFIAENYKDVNSFIIVKIPLYYMGWRHRNGTIESFVPIFKSCIDADTSLTRTYLIPELIYGVYNKKTKEYIDNDKYNLFYDLNGLHFCSEQIEEMFGFECYELYREAFCRWESDYDELKECDIKEHIWDKTVKYYKSSKIKKKILNINKNKCGRR